MLDFIKLILMNVVLGTSSFAVGILTLSIPFSRYTMSRLIAFDSGLLLGAGLGVIIPEGVEAVVDLNIRVGNNIPTSKIAFSLLAGFTLMLIMEQLVSPHGHSHSHVPLAMTPQQANKVDNVEFDAELGELEREHGVVGSSRATGSSSPRFSAELDVASVRDIQRRVYPLTLGLVFHAIADGLALGASIMSDAGSFKLSFIVFFALIIHKAPTAVALTTSLLAHDLPKADCKIHVAVFSVATPVGAFFSYALLSFIGSMKDLDWTGIVMLVSGGSFLYVATMLQPVLPHGGPRIADNDIGRKSRLLFIILGMFVPICISSTIGHGHS